MKKIIFWVRFLKMAQRRPNDLHDPIVDKVLADQLIKYGVEPPPQDGCTFKYMFHPGYCKRQRLEGYDLCFYHVPDTAKYQPEIMQRYFGKAITLKDALEAEVSSHQSLAGAFLKNAKIGGNWFNKGVNLNGADLHAANFVEAHLSYGSLNGANLALANLDSAYLSDVDVRGAIFSGANLHNVKFRNTDFSGVKGLSRECFKGTRWGFWPVYHILETYPDQCATVYRDLASYFSRNGSLESASWAAYRERIIHHRLLKKKVRLVNQIVEAITKYTLYGGQTPIGLVFLRWLGDVFDLILSYLYCLIFGYGEKPGRVIISSILTVFVYATIYYLSGALSEFGFRSALYFSVITFTTLGYGDIIPKEDFRLIAASEAILGILLIGLFLFTLSRRAVGR